MYGMHNKPLKSKDSCSLCQRAEHDARKYFSYQTTEYYTVHG